MGSRSSPTSARAAARADSDRESHDGVVGVEPLVVLDEPTDRLIAARCSTSDHAEAVFGRYRDSALEQHACRHPLANQLEEASRLRDHDLVRRPQLTPRAHFRNAEGRRLGVPFGGLDLLPRDAGCLDRLDQQRSLNQRGRHVERVASAADVPAFDHRPGKQALTRSDGDVGSWRLSSGEPAHEPPPTASSRNVRRCCSSATSSPNIRLYSVACSTGLVRWSLDLTSAIRRIAVSSWSR